jgi:hypothetical protein
VDDERRIWECALGSVAVVISLEALLLSAALSFI